MDHSKSSITRIAVALCFLIAALFFNKVAHSPSLQVSSARLATLQAGLQAHAQKRALATHIAEEYRISLERAREIVKLAFNAATSQGISPYLVLGVIAQESSFRAGVASGYGAVGLMQVVPRWHPEKLAQARDPVSALSDPAVNVRVGSLILKEYLSKGKGVQWALAKYSGKAHNYSTKVLAYADRFSRIAKRTA